MPESLSVRKVALKTLVSDPQNVRTHDEKNLEAIRRSLTAFGQRKPIVVAPSNDGRLVVIAGNGTLEAARSLGWTDIEVTEVPKDWDADKARAYAIADNRTAELADWNQIELASALLDLDAVGWSAQDMGFELPDSPDFQPEDEEQPRLDEKNPTTCPACGHTWTTVGGKVVEV
jgi:ParB-like chromosome segregation protein Spo0J